MGHARRCTGVFRCPAFWWGPARLPVLLRRKPCSPLPSASKMDSHSGSSAFPVIIPHALQPCLLLTELPSCGLAGGGSGGVRQSPRLPRPRAPPHPRRPKWREGRQLPRPRPLFVWRGGGELRLAPGASWPLPSPPGSLHTALIVCDAPHGCADVEPPPWPPSAQVPVFGKERTLPPRLPGGGGLTGYEAGLTQSVRLISSWGDGTPSSEVLLEALHPYMGVSYSSSACPTAP